jgi:hypothetical protein
MPPVRSNCASVLLLIAMLVSDCAWASEQTEQAPSRECPVTDVKGDSDYGNEYLHAILAWPNMTIAFGPNGPGFRLEDGSRTMKLAWYRLVHGELTIEGRRLDGAAPPSRAWVPEGYSPDIGSISTASNQKQPSLFRATADRLPPISPRSDLSSGGRVFESQTRIHTRIRAHALIP